MGSEKRGRSEMTKATKTQAVKKPKLTRTQPEEDAHEREEEFLEAIEREAGEEKTQSDDHPGESRVMDDCTLARGDRMKCL